jgi:hypothetical protein
MATLHLKRPTDLLGRHVTGSYLAHGVPFAFSGVVEAVVLPAPGIDTFSVEFYVGSEFISLPACTALDYSNPSGI